MQDICPSTAKNTHIYVRTLHDACKKIGGEQKLAQHLGVDVETIEAWLNGQSLPPDHVFLRCIDLIEQTTR